MATLSNKNINDTYFGLLKTNESTSIAGCGLTRVVDGVGCKTSLSLGDGNSGGVCVHGNLSFGTVCGFNFPVAGSSSNEVMLVNSSNVTLGNVSNALSINTDQFCYNSNTLNLNPTCVTAIEEARNIWNTRGTVFITNESGDTRYFRNNNGKTCICLKELAASGFQKIGGKYCMRVNLYRRVGRGDYHLKSSIFKTTTSDNVPIFALETNGDYRVQGNGYLGNSHIEIFDANSGRSGNVANFSVGSTRNFNF
jgi:hypothetical protein